MSRALPLALLLAFVFAPSALAARVVATAEYCTGGDECRYFPNARLAVNFVAEPGERNVPTALTDGTRVTVRDSSAPVVPGSNCESSGPNEVVCRSNMVESVLYVQLSTGDMDDLAMPTGPAIYELGEGEDTARGGNNYERFSGGPGADDLAGGELGDDIAGDEDADLVRGEGGNDSLSGGSGNDRVYGGRGLDDLHGDSGSDRLDGGRDDDELGGGPGRDRLVGGHGRDKLLGRSGSDRLLAGPGRDRLDGGPGRDVLDAGSGNDRIGVRDGRRDRVRCGPGFDRVTADRFDVLRGCEHVRRR